MTGPMFPRIYVELTGACNMACDFCPNSVKSRPNMDYGLFTSIIDQIAENNISGRVELAAIGESLLHPRLLDALKYCRSKGLQVGLITNSLLLTADMYEALADAGLAELQVSFHDLSADSLAYRHARPPVSYEAFRGGLLGVLERHVSRKLPVRLIICLMFCKEEWLEGKLWDLPALKENTRNAAALLRPFVAEINAIARRHGAWCRLTDGVVAMALRLLEVYRGRHIEILENVSLNVSPLNPQLFNTRRKLAGPLGKAIRLRERERGTCRRLDIPMILSNGSFIPCCIDGLEELVMGRVDSSTSLLSVINGEKYQALLRSFREGVVADPVCRQCLGRLEYISPFSRLKYAVSSLSLAACERVLREQLWGRLSQENKYRIKKALGLK